MISRIHLLLQQHRAAQAEQLCRQALAQDSQDAELWRLLAQALLAQQQHSAAGMALQQALALEPESDFSYYLLARVQVGQDLLQVAQRTIRQALAIDPLSPDYYAEQSYIELRLGHFQAALQAAEAGLGTDPLHVGCRNLQARALATLGKQQESVTQFALSLQQDPADPHTHTNLGFTLLEAGNHAQARHHFAEALRLDPQQDIARVGLLRAFKSRFWPYSWGLQATTFLGRILAPMLADASPVMRVVMGRVIFLLLTVLFWRLLIATGLIADDVELSDAGMLLIALLGCTVLFLLVVKMLFNTLLRLDQHARFALTSAEVHRSNIFLGILSPLGVLLGILLLPVLTYPLIVGLTAWGVLGTLLGGLQLAPGTGRRRSWRWAAMTVISGALAAYALPNDGGARLWLLIVCAAATIYLWIYDAHQELI